MTMKNVRGINAAETANAATAESVLERAAQLARTVAEKGAARTKAADDAAITARVIDRRHVDSILADADELDQLSEVLTDPAATPPAQPVDDATPAADTPPATPPAQPVATTPAPADDVAPTVPQPVAEPVAPVAPVATVPFVPAANAVAVAVNNGGNDNGGQNALNPRHWSLLSIILAILLGLLGLSIGWRTVGWLLPPDLPTWEVFSKIAQFIYGGLWILAIGAIGFFGGGLIGAALGNAWNNRNQPAAPAAPVAPVVMVPAAPQAVPVAAPVQAAAAPATAPPAA